MKVRNVILTVLASMILIAGALPAQVNATESKELGIVSLREGGYGYQANSRNVWKIVEYTNGKYTYDNAFYCLKGGKGFGDSSHITNRTYDLSYDLKKISLIPNSVKPILPSDEAKTYTTGGETYTYTDYNAVLWLLDNIYLPKAENAAALKANLYKIFPASMSVKLTDDDLEVIQQCAIWYFTNNDSANAAEYIYHMENLPELQLTRQEGGVVDDENLYALSDLSWERATQATMLYDYLISEAKTKSAAYGNGDTRETTVAPAEVSDTTVKAELIKGKCIVGPFRIAQTSTAYEIEGTLTDQAGNVLEYTLLNGNKEAVEEGTTLKDLANTYFYLQIDDNKSITSLTFNTEISYGTTETIFWTVGGAEISEQPVVEVKKVNKTIPKEQTVTIDRKYFDLSLRKFITSINENSTTNRVPEVITDTLKTGTTATYEHSKMPLAVAPGDIVTYKIRVYNEGQVDGYAEEITDYVPEGLGFIIGHNTNSENRWVVSEEQSVKTVKLTSIPNVASNVNISDFTTDITDLSKVEVVTGKVKITTDKLAYDETDTQKTTLIKAYDEELATIYNQEVEVVCVVLGDVDQDTNLKNIAEISKYTDEYGYEVPGKDGGLANGTNIGNSSEPGSNTGTTTSKGINVSIFDRDSTANNVNINTYPENTNVQDDDDYEQLVVKDFDLALRKFITAVGTQKITDRKPIPTINSTTGEITYQHPKDVVRVKNGDLVEYTIRVYNEGSLAGYATEVRDTLPEGLEFVKDNEINKQYGWATQTGDSQTIVTSYLSSSDKLIPAFDRGTMPSPEFKDLKVVCKVNVADNSSIILTNTAEIEDDAIEDSTTSQKKDVTDKDSTPGNNKPGEDDIDTESVQIVIFDLALKKFITGVNDEEITTREPLVALDEEGHLKYTYIKDPVLVKNNDIVTYTIRIYNEGNIDGYVDQVKDDVPQGLVFLPDNEINIKYDWKLQEDGTIRTTYLAHDPQLGEAVNEIQAFDAATMGTPDYRDVQVAFRVDESDLPQDRVIINTAEISKDYNEFGVEDEDSTPDNNKTTEDDIDKEYLRVQYFDLSLLKYITEVQIVEDGKLRVVQTGHTGEEDPEPMVKVEINKNKINTTIVDFIFTIKVTNEGEIAGYAKEIIDRVPQGLEFVAEDNPNWIINEDGEVITDQLADTLLYPGDSATVEIMLRWINGEENLKEKVNVAEINKDYNDSNSKDIDSTPGNNVDGEDDQDDAAVILSIKTGIEPSYVGVVAAGLGILAVGVTFIRRFVI